jgi:two-component system sensor histidine kinase RegB
MVSLSSHSLSSARESGAALLRPGGIHATGEGLRLQTIVRLRWLAVFGQAGAVLFVAFVLGFPFPLAWCLAVIALSAWLNIFLTLRWRTSVRLHERYSTLLLAYDIVQLAALLFLTGGLANPFAFLFIVPVAVSAATLPPTRTLWLGALALVLAAVLAFIRLPLPWEGGVTFALPPLYIAGMWVAVACCVVFSALYSGRTAAESRQMSNALAATEMILAREQKLSALDGLAAAAAHELGTPLATIQLVANELKRGIPDPQRLEEDLDLLVSQSARCRDILSRLSNRDAQMDDMFARQKLSEMLEEIVEPLRGSEVAILFDLKPEMGEGGEGIAEPILARNPGLRYGLTNLVENAIDFATTRVEIEVGWSMHTVTLEIRDDGPGFAQDVMDRLGDPFVTTRRRGEAVAERGGREGHGGMGLGFFIAKTLLERSGARVSLANKRQPEHGAIIRLDWPRAWLEQHDLMSNQAMA